jgi:hypothetical protein
VDLSWIPSAYSTVGVSHLTCALVTSSCIALARVIWMIVMEIARVVRKEAVS